MRRVACLAPYNGTIFIKTCHFKRSLAINIAFKEEIPAQKKIIPGIGYMKENYSRFMKNAGHLSLSFNWNFEDTSSLNFQIFSNAWKKWCNFTLHIFSRSDLTFPFDSLNSKAKHQITSIEKDMLFDFSIKIFCFSSCKFGTQQLFYFHPFFVPIKTKIIHEIMIRLKMFI